MHGDVKVLLGVGMRLWARAMRICALRPRPLGTWHLLLLLLLLKR